MNYRGSTGSGAGGPYARLPAPPDGGGTGMLVKDYRGKNAELEIWKFDGALVAQICDALKQAAIEEGQWSEKREPQGTVTIEFIREKLNYGRQRALADWKRRHPEGDGAVGWPSPKGSID